MRCPTAAFPLARVANPNWVALQIAVVIKYFVARGQQCHNKCSKPIFAFACAYSRRHVLTFRVAESDRRPRRVGATASNSP